MNCQIHCISKNGTNAPIGSSQSLKPTDELKISFDNDDFYKSLTFSGEGAYVNTYLLNKKSDFLDKRGRLKEYYKKEVRLKLEKQIIPLVLTSACILLISIPMTRRL